ncbi:foldase protein PrsA [Seinonella peptonophila]|uniref:Foldase protein PrsA n=1 Tax=Seinonella peptonophila TaxID=112248 RepID=A0A1M4YMV7_9BACL|nr:peptidylprolyl isomerase [Seinonella peptonophila]SHF06967.1 foldase protein PrsA [Seinonella peptonophila]
MQLLNKRWISAVLVVLMSLTTILAGCGKEEPKKKPTTKQETETGEFKPFPTNSKKVVATYEKGQITEGELNLYINILAFIDYKVAMLMGSPQMKNKLKEFKEILVKGYVAELLIADQVKDQDQYRKKADEELSKIEGSIKNPTTPGVKKASTLDEAIKDKGFNRQQLTDFIVRSLQRNAYFDKQIENEKYTKVKAKHILIAFNKEGNEKEKRSDAEAKKRAEEVKKKLDQGGDFDKLAKEYSDDPGSKDNGGLIEGAADEYVPEFAQAVKTIELNKISDPIKTEYGYHVLTVMERNEESMKDAPDEVKQKKLQELNQKFIEQQKITVKL